MATGIYLSGRLHRVKIFPYRLEKQICTACVTQQRTSRDNILELSAPRGLSTSNISLHKWILFICMLEHICFWTLGIFWSGVITILLSCISYERRKGNTNIIINIEHLILLIIPSTPPMRRILSSFLSYCGLFLESLNAQKQNCDLTKKWYLIYHMIYMMFGNLVLMQFTAALQQKKHKTDLKTTAKSWKPSGDEVFRDKLFGKLCM